MLAQCLLRVKTVTMCAIKTFINLSTQLANQSSFILDMSPFIPFSNMFPVIAFAHILKKWNRYETTVTENVLNDKKTSNYLKKKKFPVLILLLNQFARYSALPVGIGNGLTLCVYLV